MIPIVNHQLIDPQSIVTVRASNCLEAVHELTRLKNTRAFIIDSAGFSDENPDGASMEFHAALMGVDERIRIGK